MLARQLGEPCRDHVPGGRHARRRGCRHQEDRSGGRRAAALGARQRFHHARVGAARVIPFVDGDQQRPSLRQFQQRARVSPLHRDRQDGVMRRRVAAVPVNQRPSMRHRPVHRGGADDALLERQFHDERVRNLGQDRAPRRRRERHRARPAVDPQTGDDDRRQDPAAGRARRRQPPQPNPGRDRQTQHPEHREAGRRTEPAEAWEPGQQRVGSYQRQRRPFRRGPQRQRIHKDGGRPIKEEGRTGRPTPASAPPGHDGRRHHQRHRRDAGEQELLLRFSGQRRPEPQQAASVDERVEFRTEAEHFAVGSRQPERALHRQVVEEPGDEQ